MYFCNQCISMLALLFVPISLFLVAICDIPWNFLHIFLYNFLFFRFGWKVNSEGVYRYAGIQRNASDN